MKAKSPHRFLVNPENGCWEWQRATSKGYGVIRIKGKLCKAHRVVYEEHCGPIPAGLDLDHLCRNRCCVNPWHLEPVTRAENLRRGKMAVLTIEDVRKIRALRGVLSQRQLERAFNLSHGYVSLIWANKIWKEEDGEEVVPL